MEHHYYYIVKRHSDGARVNIHLKPVKDVRSALRFSTDADFETFIHGYYGPDDPTDYYLQPIKISYEEVDGNE